MVEWIDVYNAFRRAQSAAKERSGFRTLKDPEAWLAKQTIQTQESLRLAAAWFNTKWHHINIDKFMACGFELYPSFSYHMFFNPRIMNHYVQRDRNEKRQMEVSKRRIIESAKFIKVYCRDNNLTFLQYCNKAEGFQHVITDHAVKGYVDQVFLMYLVSTGAVTMNEEEKVLLPNLVERGRELMYEAKKMSSYINMVVKEMHNGNRVQGRSDS